MNFIEQWFGISPDGGNGSLELLYILVDRLRHLVPAMSLSPDSNGGQAATIGWELSEPVAPLVAIAIPSFYGLYRLGKRRKAEAAGDTRD